MPALLFGQALFERGHGLSALGDLVEDFAVGDVVHALGIGEARWRGIVGGSIGAVTFSGFAMAVDTFIEINGASGGEGGWGGWDGIFAKFGCFGDFPLPALVDSEGDGDANEDKESGEEQFAEAERALRAGGGGQEEIFAYGVGRLKKEMFRVTQSAQRSKRSQNRKHARERISKNKEVEIGTKLLAAKDEPKEFGVEEEDGGGDDPRDDDGETRVGELAHFATVAGELDERDDREGQLKTQDYLAEDEQGSDLALAGDADNEGGGNKGERASDEAAEPRLETNL